MQYLVCNGVNEVDVCDKITDIVLLKCIAVCLEKVKN